MINVLLVGAGGFIGAVSRYGVTLGIARLVQQPSFPWGVLAANVLGSLIIGALAGIAEARGAFSNEARLFLFIGVLGGFTTFSAITNDTLAMLRGANYVGALGNVGLSLALGLTVAAAGYALGRSV